MMAVLTSNIALPHKAPSGGLETRSLPIAGYTNFGGGTTAHIIYANAIVICDVSDTDGYFRAAPLSSSTNSAGGDIFGGVALERQDITASDLADGAKEVTCAVNGIWGFAQGSLAQTDIGAPAYASDDQTITTTDTNNWWVGTIVEVDGTYVYVEIAHAAGRTNTAT